MQVGKLCVGQDPIFSPCQKRRLAGATLASPQTGPRWPRTLCQAKTERMPFRMPNGVPDLECQNVCQNICQTVRQNVT